MIRPGPGLPLIFRLQLRAQLAAARFGESVRALKENSAKSLERETAKLRRIPAAVLRLVRRERAPESLVVEAMTVEEFEERYSEFVDLLCGAAQHLLTADDRARYSELQTWLMERYAHLRPALQRWLEPAAEDGPPCGPNGAQCDAFEALFQASTPDDSASCHLAISRITRTRRAIDDLATHLQG